MAKRKRLIVPGGGDPLPETRTAPETKSALGPGLAPPIAHVAGDAAARAALDEVSREMAAARNEGRLIQNLPLGAIEASWIVRDRIRPGHLDDEEMVALIESLRSHGQRTPIEVSALPGGRFGLISGWRRLTALNHLHAETGSPRFATVQALLRSPETAADAYVSMIEENEIRLGLSNFERARIVGKAVEAGVFTTRKEALNGLFGSVSRAKRSKIGSFLTIYQMLDGALLFPERLGERLGLVLARALEARPDLAPQLIAALEAEAPATAEDEQALIQAILAAGDPAPPISAPPAPGAREGGANTAPTGAPSKAPTTAPTTAPARGRTPQEIAPGLVWADQGAGLHLSGPALTPEMRSRLRQWLLVQAAAQRR
jgi:hypothetical protein